MSYALNEVEAMGKKAARGAGMSWGMAEEAGRAARWLCAQGIDGAAVLAATLAQIDYAIGHIPAPVSLHGDWHAANGDLCPLMTGAALSDAAMLWAETGKRLAAVACPALLLPFAAQAALRQGGPVTVEWAGIQAVTDGSALQIAGTESDAMTTGTESVSVATGGALTAPRPRHTRATPDTNAWAALTALAHRTYAPETEQSRLRGAGAGLTDND